MNVEIGYAVLYSARGFTMHHGDDLHGPGVDRVEVRRRIRMVFQKPNPVARSICDNIA